MSSLTLRGTQGSENAVWWTVRVSDPQGRLATTVGGQLCPPGSTYPFGSYCTGALFGRDGTAFEASYTGLFWISPDAPGGDWIPRFDPIAGGATIVGNQRVRVTAKPVTTTTVAPTTTVAGVVRIVSESLSVSSLTLRGTQGSENAVWWTVRVSDPQGRLATTVGGQLCPPGSTYPFGSYCTGALFGRDGTAFEASYTGLFWISPDAPGGDWIPRFDPIAGGATIVGNQRVRVTAKTAG